MNETSRNESPDSQMPAQEDNVQFPPFPDPNDVDFDEDITEEERKFYKTKFKDLNSVTTHRMHCTSCDRHLGCSASNDGRMRMHPMLRTLVCNTCYKFYNSGEFEKGDDGSELYCRWCGQGGQVYCCSDCPHVFCAKCIKRNLGISKIKEIENTDDWKCFKCNHRSLWDLRASCWALLRYCDFKNRITMATQDQDLKEKYSADCAKDYSECCRNKKRREKLDSKKKEEKKDAELSAKKASSAAAVISKIPPTIQVKKFASINIDDTKSDKKATKRSLSPKPKPVFLKNPIAVQTSKSFNTFPSMPKKIRMSSSPNIINPVRFVADRSKTMNTNTIRIRPTKGPNHLMPVLGPLLNGPGFNSVPTYNSFINDNINLSLESLTQGLDMAAVASMNNNSQEDDVVCTPDFPMEPLCEVTEDNADDDVQCITPMGNNRISQPPPLIPRLSNTLPDLSADNIIQMTENDVTVNAQTGGLKFRVDPQTLSSNKMYRLPDGRIFAINANPNMPGGYSATIVAVTETAAKNVPKGSTYAAKLSAVPTQTASPIPKPNRTPVSRPVQSAKRAPKSTTTKVTRSTETVTRECDLEVPVEWYRYNLIDAVDALEYSLSRLNKLKKDATTVHLRTRTVSEMKALHKTLERLLHTSTTRFNEIRDNLNKGLKQYLAKKTGNNSTNNISDDDDDDDVEILPNPGENDDPIFIDENSLDSNANSIDQQEVDLTGGLSNSELNDSSDKTIEMLDENFLKANEEMDNTSDEKNDTLSKSDDVDPLGNAGSDHSNKNTESNSKDNSSKVSEVDPLGDSVCDQTQKNNENAMDENKQTDKANSDDVRDANNKNMNYKENEVEEIATNGKSSEGGKIADKDNSTSKDAIPQHDSKSLNGAGEPMNLDDSELKDEDQILNSSTDKSGNKTQENVSMEDKKNDNQDSEMSEEMIETLLKGDDCENDDDSQTIDSTEIIGV